MASELLSLSELFKDRLFRIPDYQRGYAWKKSQLTDFWEDLMNLGIDKRHYTGLLSLKEIKSDDNGKIGEWLPTDYKIFHIVDGQQRLATFLILLFEIIKLLKRVARDKEPSEEEPVLGGETLGEVIKKYIVRKRPPENSLLTYLFGYEEDNPSSRYLKQKIFEEPDGGSLFETYYTKNLQDAKCFFAKNLELLNEKEGLDGIRALYLKLTTGLCFNIFEIADDYDVFVAFETMNNRGKKLTNLELLKNRLIYLTTLFDNLDDTDKRNDRKLLNDTWKEVCHQLGRNKDASLSDDEFLRAHWISYYMYSRKKGNDYSAFLFGKFSAKNVFGKTAIDEEEASSPMPYDEPDNDDEINSVEDATEQQSTGKLEPKEIRDYAKSLKSFAESWYYSYFPDDSKELSDEEKTWIQRLNRVGIGYFRPLVAAAISKQGIDNKKRVELFKAIERFIFLAFRVAGYNSSWKSSEYYRAARDLYRSEPAKFIPTIARSLNDTIEKWSDDIVSSFISKGNKRFESGEGFYAWRGLRYFLYEYEYSLAVKNDIHKVYWNFFTQSEKDKISIEHILPQTPTNKYWKRQLRGYSDKKTKALTASLGNMLPLKTAINSSLQNDSFPDKKNPPNPMRRGYAKGSNSEIEVSENKDWTPVEILKRGMHLLDFMSERWSIKFTDEQKLQILHLENVVRS
jgi:uncharacterized protein with ParB-like and HNH nuclease domain